MVLLDISFDDSDDTGVELDEDVLWKGYGGRTLRRMG